MTRRERRKMERELGLVENRNIMDKKAQDIRKRKHEMGRRLHNQTLERIENELRKLEEENYTDAYVRLIDAGKSDKEAKEILDNINKAEERRQEELRMRKIKRKVRRQEELRMRKNKRKTRR